MRVLLLVASSWSLLAGVPCGTRETEALFMAGP
jgi:hypothetical protein